MKLFMAGFLTLAVLLPSAFSYAGETLISSDFKITKLKYRGSNSSGYTRYEDCADCLLIEGGNSEACGTGFVIRGGSTEAEKEEAKFLRSLAMMAHASGKNVQIGRNHCVKWDGEWRGEVNRIYIVE